MTKPKGTEQREVAVWPARAVLEGTDAVAQEVPVALSYNGVSHVVMMASPTQLEEFALGFSLTEGIISGPQDIYATDISQQDQGIELALTVSNRSFATVQKQRRNMTGRTGCGLCGAESLAQVHKALAPVSPNFLITHQAIEAASLSLSSQQPLQLLAGAVHAAAWCTIDGNIVCVREDVGRHNALDKLVGALWADQVFEQPGFLLISSRASFEMVQKAGSVGIAIVVALSAPTSLAIDIAGEAGITLVGFSRAGRHVSYTHPERLIENNL